MHRGTIARKSRAGGDLQIAASKRRARMRVRRQIDAERALSCGTGGRVREVPVDVVEGERKQQMRIEPGSGKFGAFGR